MGVSVNGQCVPDAVTAASEVCSSYPRTSVDGGAPLTWSCVAAAPDGSSVSLLRSDSTGNVVVQSLAVSFPACDDMQPYNDSLTVWGLILTAAAGVFCVKTFVYRLVTNQ
jgi:hypothetical protein